MTRQEHGDDRLTLAAKQLHQDYLDTINPKKRIWRNFFDGIIRGLGIAIGGTIVFAIVGYLLSTFLLIPGVEKWINEIKEGSSSIQGFTEEGPR